MTVQTLIIRALEAVATEAVDALGIILDSATDDDVRSRAASALSQIESSLQDLAAIHRSQSAELDATTDE